MADNISTTAGTFATDDLAGVHYERLKFVLGADGVNDGDVHSSNPMPVTFSTVVNLGTISSIATQATLGNVSTFANSTNTLLIQVSSNTASSNSLLSSVLQRLTTVSTAISTITTPLMKTAIFDAGGSQITSFGGGTQYVEGNTTTAPTGTVMMWKSAVSTIVPVTSSVGLPVNVIAGSLNANTEYIEGATTTLPTGIVMLWKSAVSTLVPASTSNPFPVSSLPLTANLGTISSVATEATLGNISTYTNSTNTLLLAVSSNTASTNALISTDTLTVSTRLNNISTFTNSTNTLLIQVSSNTASTNALLSTQTIRLENISTYTNSTNALLVQVSSNTASTNALVSTHTLTVSTRLNNISTFTNSTNTLLVQVSSNTASSNALLSTISARLAPVPIGIYTQPVAVSSNGLSVFRTLDADETEEQISATACTVYGVWVTNTSTTAAYLKFYNGTSSAVFVSSATPLITFGVPGSSTQALTGAVLSAGGLGINFSTACCVAAVTGAADGNEGAPGASSVIVNVFYKN